MAALLKSAAVASINRGQPSSFYSKDKTNPVFQSLDQEIKKFMGYMRKINSPNYRKPEEEASSRAFVFFSYSMSLVITCVMIRFQLEENAWQVLAKI